MPTQGLKCTNRDGKEVRHGERGHVKWLAGGKVMVDVNVYSARRGGPDNILDCDFFDDALTLAQQAPLTLHCKLIGEP